MLMLGDFERGLAKNVSKYLKKLILPKINL